MKNLSVLLVIYICPLLASCANPVVHNTFNKYQRLGDEASISGNLEAAEEYFRRAYINAQVGNLGNKYQAEALHNLALTKHDLCKLDEAEELLAKAILLRGNLEKEGKLSKDQKRFLVGSYLEISALYYSRGKFKESAESYEWVLPALRESPISTDAKKQMFSGVLNEYAIALENENRKDEMRAVREEEVQVLGELEPNYTTVSSMLGHPNCQRR